MEKTMEMNIRILGTDNGREEVRGMAQGRKRGHVAIWLEILRDVRTQWVQAEHDMARRRTL